MKKALISVVVPCFNEESTLPIFYKKIDDVSKKMKRVNFEFIFINDGSKDNTLRLIKSFSEIDERVKYISFSRNFGKEAGIYAGLLKFSGDYVCIMDCDLQDPPELLIDMYEMISTGEYDSIATRRVNRKGEPIIRSFLARRFYKIINKISKIEMVDGARDFRLMNKKFADSITSLKEYNRYSKGLFNFVGFKSKWLEYQNVKRVAGESKWSLKSLFKYAMDGIVSFSTIPLSIASFLGLIFFLISILFIFIIIIKTLCFGDKVGGWPSLACIILFVSGIQLLCMGIIGKYLSKIFLEVKQRPIYIIDEDNLSDKENS